MELSQKFRNDPKRMIKELKFCLAEEKRLTNEFQQVSFIQLLITITKLILMKKKNSEYSSATGETDSVMSKSYNDTVEFQKAVTQSDQNLKTMESIQSRIRQLGKGLIKALNCSNSCFSGQDIQDDKDQIFDIDLQLSTYANGSTHYHGKLKL